MYLAVSNGHGEDEVAVRVLAAMRRQNPHLQLAALPIVGTGFAYVKASIEVVGTRKVLPSGGFLRNDRLALWQDLREGLVNLTQLQYRTVREYARRGWRILAVGDLIPLLFGYLSGSEYYFIGTAKSEYYIRDRLGNAMATPFWFEAATGSFYLPWERWLLAQKRCLGVFPRDTLTAKVLDSLGIAVEDCGNPMMDGIADVTNSFMPLPTDPLAIVLLPGSRSPEALRNWQTILQAVAQTIVSISYPQRYYAAIAPSISREEIATILLAAGWQEATLSFAVADEAATFWQKEVIVAGGKRQAELVVTKAFRDCLSAAALGIGMAGTAIEQCVGLGKPVMTIVGEGPQFTAAFAREQVLLLGESIVLSTTPAEVSQAIAALLADPSRQAAIYDNGLARMGSAGGSDRIAKAILESGG
jgi:uncharacterized protein (TIGR03492 family)